MVGLTVAVEDMKHQLAEVIRGAIEKGFELVAGVVGGNMAKTMEQAVRDAAELAAGMARGSGVAGEGAIVDIVGLREQIKENATVLYPLLAAHRTTRATITPSNRTGTGTFKVITSGTCSTGGIRAYILELIPTPNVLLWSKKHISPAGALAELLDLTQGKLKHELLRTAAGVSPAVGAGEGGFPSFGQREYDATVEVDVDATFWDAEMVTNPSFEGFNYASFSTEDSDDSGLVSDQATCKFPW